MRNLIPLSLLALAACATPPAGEPPPPLTTVTIPDYDSDRGIRWSSSREAYDAARADTRYVMEQFTYLSDGLTVGAYLYRARQPGSPTWPAAGSDVS